jgi:hypothetical protein
MAVGSAVVLWWARKAMCRLVVVVLEGAVLEWTRRGRDKPVLT